MAKLPLIEQQTSVGQVRASGQDFGAGVGQSLAQAGDVMGDIGIRMIEREATFDSLTRARDLETYATESLRALEDTDDISRSATIEKYGQSLRQKQQELLNGHTGTGRTRAALRNQLENQVIQFEKGARERQVKAQHAMMADILEQRTNQIAAQVAFAPELMQQGFEEMDAQIAQLADALPQAATETYRNSARSAIVVNTLAQLESRNQIDAADALLKDPNVTKYLNPDQSRRFVLNIGAEKGKRAVEERKRAENLQTISSVIGIPVEQMTPQQRSMAEGFGDATMNLAEKMSLVQMVQGSPLTPAQRNKIMGLEDTRRQNQVQSLIADLPAFEARRMTPDELSAFAVEAEKVFPTQYRQNVDTGQYVPIPGSGGIERLMQVVGRASSAAGLPMRQPQSMSPGAAPPMGDQGGMAPIPGYEGMGWQDAQGNQYSRGPDGELRPDFFAQPADGTPDGQADQTLGSTPTIQRFGGLWNLADKVAGPIAGVKRGIGGGPIPLGIGQDEVAAAQEVELQQRNLVRALQQNPRYAEGERQDIAKSISIEPAVMSNPDAYRTRLIQIGRYVQEELAFQSSVLKKSPSETTPEMRQQAMQAIPLFQKFYERMGLPQQVKSAEDAKKLPRGTEFLTPDGRLLRRN